MELPRRWNLHALQCVMLALVLVAHTTASQSVGAPPDDVDVSLGDPGFPPQTVAPNLHTAPMLMVHLPKCAGTSARNALHDIMMAKRTLPERMCIPGTPATPKYTILNISDCRPELREADGKTPLPLSRDAPFVLAAGHFKYDWTVKELIKISQVCVFVCGSHGGRMGGHWALAALCGTMLEEKGASSGIATACHPHPPPPSLRLKFSAAGRPQNIMFMCFCS